ncbi:MAG TPA: hypothetical protein VGQ03_07985 [Nitrososphaera sp.]|nr:hypothetical protein [Nitrososphaera sp.]
MSFDRHPRLMLVVATACVIVAWFGAMRLLAFMGVSQNFIIIIAPISSVVVAMIFLYLGRKKLRGPKDSDFSPFLELESPIMVTGGQAPNPMIAAETPTPEPEQNPMIATETPAAEPEQSPMIAAEMPASVQRVMNEIEKRSEIRCLVITAPSHGVLQDRLNNWLSGSYGRVVSTSMAMNEKGFFLTLFYEPSAVQ